MTEFDFSTLLKKEDSEPLQSTETSSSQEQPTKPQEQKLTNQNQKDTKDIEEQEIDSQTAQKNDIKIGIPLNASARLNLIKFLYPLLTGKSTTNKHKKVMKKAVLDKIRDF